MEMENIYREPEQVSAIIFGHLVKTFGKVTVTNMNKLLVELGYDRINAKELNELASSLGENPELGTLVDKAVSGEITLEQLENYYTEEKVYKTKSLHDVITPYQVEHQRVLADNRAFNKVQKSGALAKIYFEDIKDELTKSFSQLTKPEYNFKSNTRVVTSDSTVIVLLSDWHVGAEVFNKTTGGYNTTILIKRLKALFADIEYIVETNAPEEIKVYFLGDVVEGSYMRQQQSWANELTSAEQVSMGTRLITDFLTQTESLGLPVKFGIISGNHDRFSGDKNQSIYFDSVAYVILDTLMLLKEHGMLPNTSIIDNRDDIYRFEDTTYGKTYMAIHGDTIKGRGANIPKLIKDHNIDYLLTGHVHNFQVNQEDYARMHIVTGSIMGANDYSASLNLALSTPSQTILVASETRDLFIYTKYFKD